MRGANAIAVLALAAAASGCGGGSDSAGVKSTIDSYYGALSRGDGPGACAELAQSTRQQLQRTFHRDCAAVITQASRTPRYRSITAKIKAARVTAVHLAGASATATVVLAGVSESVSLGKEGGAWKIESSHGV